MSRQKDRARLRRSADQALTAIWWNAVVDTQGGPDSLKVEIKPPARKAPNDRP